MSAKPNKMYMCLKCGYMRCRRVDLERHCARVRQCTSNQDSWPQEKPAEYTTILSDQSGNNIYRLDQQDAHTAFSLIRDIVRTEVAQQTQHDLSQNQQNQQTTIINNDNVTVTININASTPCGFNKEDLTHLTPEKLAYIYQNIPIADILLKVIDAIYFDEETHGRNATFILPHKGDTALVRDPAAPNRWRPMAAAEVAAEVANKSIIVMDESMNEDDQPYYTRPLLDQNTNRYIDDHIDALYEAMHIPTSADSIKVIKDVKRHVVNKQDALILAPVTRQSLIRAT